MPEAGAIEAGPWWPFVVMTAGAAATYAWRALGVALSGRIDPEDAAFEWFACVAYALLTGLIARMILLPTGPLAETPLVDRVFSAGLAALVYFAARRNILLGVGSGVAALVLATWARTIAP